MSSPWVERGFARPHLPNNKSAQTHRKFIRSENQKSQKRTPPATSNSFQCKSSYDLFKHVLFQEVKGLPSNMPASYHWEPPASTLAHRLAVIHPKIRTRWPQGSNAMPSCRSIGALCRHPSTSPTPGQRCADWTTRPFKPDVQSMGRARFCKTTFTKKQICTNSPKGHSIWEPKISEKDILIQCKNSYDLFEHVQFQEAKGLPSNMPASYHWEPPASTLAHRLAVIHPKNQDALAPRVQCHALCVSRCVGFETTHCRHPSTSPTPGQRCADWTTRPFKPDIQSMGRARFCKTTFTHEKVILSENQSSQKRTSPAASNSFPNAKAHTIYSNMCCFKKWKASPPTCQPVTTGNPQRAL